MGCGYFEFLSGEELQIRLSLLKKIIISFHYKYIRFRFFSKVAASQHVLTCRYSITSATHSHTIWGQRLCPLSFAYRTSSRSHWNTTAVLGPAPPFAYSGREPLPLVQPHPGALFEPRPLICIQREASGAQARAVFFRLAVRLDSDILMYLLLLAERQTPVLWLEASFVHFWGWTDRWVYDYLAEMDIITTGMVELHF